MSVTGRKTEYQRNQTKTATTTTKATAATWKILFANMQNMDFVNECKQTWSLWAWFTHRVLITVDPECYFYCCTWRFFLSYDKYGLSCYVAWYSTQIISIALELDICSAVVQRDAIFCSVGYGLRFVCWFDFMHYFCTCSDRCIPKPHQ